MAKDTRFNDSTIYNDPRQAWEITTEGDCEGRSVKQLGVFVGRFYEIAFHLAKKCCYSLRFKPAEIDTNFTPVAKEVHVGFDIESGLWDLTPINRAEFVKSMLNKDAIVTIEPSNYYASFKVVVKEDIRSKLIKEQALSKLTEEERQVLGL